MNRVILLGRLTADPRLNVTSKGTPVCNFSIAVDRPFVEEGSEIKCDYFDIAAWGNMGEACAQYLGKGSKVCVSGYARISSYIGADNIKRRSITINAEEVEFLGPFRPQGEHGEESYAGPINDAKLPF